MTCAEFSDCLLAERAGTDAELSAMVRHAAGCPACLAEAEANFEKCARELPAEVHAQCIRDAARYAIHLMVAKTLDPEL